MITNRQQLSLFEQAQRSSPTISDERIVAGLCEEILDQAELSGPPIPVRMIASLRGIARIEAADQPFSGMLAPEDGGLAVRVRRGDGVRRQRFTICHEAAHTLLPGYLETRQFRCNGQQTWLERMCDLAAAGLLLPARFFSADLARTGFGLDAVEDLSSSYEASIEATARRMVTLWKDEPALLVVLRERHKPAEAGKESLVAPRLRVDYAVGSGGWPYVRRHKSAADSGLGRLLTEERISGLGSIDELCGQPLGEVRIDARRYGANGRVLALVRRGPGDNRQQRRGHGS